MLEEEDAMEESEETLAEKALHEEASVIGFPLLVYSCCHFQKIFVNCHI